MSGNEEQMYKSNKKKSRPKQQQQLHSFFRPLALRPTPATKSTTTTTTTNHQGVVESDSDDDDDFDGDLNVSLASLAKTKATISTHTSTTQNKKKKHTKKRPNPLPSSFRTAAVELQRKRQTEEKTNESFTSFVVPWNKKPRTNTNAKKNGNHPSQNCNQRRLSFQPSSPSTTTTQTTEKDHSNDSRPSVVSRNSSRSSSSSSSSSNRRPSTVIQTNNELSLPHEQSSNKENLLRDDSISNTAAAATTSNPMEEESTTASPPTITKDNKLSDKNDENMKGSQPSTATKRPRRIYSDSSMEFIPNNSNVKENTIKNNLISQLIRRTTHGGQQLTFRSTHSTSNPASSITPAIPKIRWKIPKRVSLSLHAGSKPQHLAWDRLGILLAVAYSDQWIRIYDWDMVRAAELSGSRERSDSSVLFKLPPVCQFRAPQAVSCLQWNQHDMDELAIGFRLSGRVHLYRVDKVSDWILQQQSRRRTTNHAFSSNRSQTQNTTIPPKSTYTHLSSNHPRGGSGCGSVRFLEFVNPETLVVGCSSSSSTPMVYCWKKTTAATREQNSTAHKLWWRYQPPSAITSCASLGNDWLLLGTEEGKLCWLQWSQRTRERSFSMEFRPIVLDEWAAHHALASHPYPYSKILHLRIHHHRGTKDGGVEGNISNSSSPFSSASSARTSNNSSNHNKVVWGRIGVSWITAGGWLLETTLETSTPPCSTKPLRRRRYKSNNTTTIVRHAPPKVQLKNADGALIVPQSDRPPQQQQQQQQSYEYSIPPAPMVTDGNLFLDTPQVTKVLPHHDKYVLTESSSQGGVQVIRSTNKTKLLWRPFAEDQRLETIALPTKAVSSPPQVLALHPGSEWLVLGVQDRLVLMVGRRHAST